MARTSLRKPRSERDADVHQRLEAALSERDRTLHELARVREELNALRLAERRRGEVAASYPVAAGLGPTPLRYVLADRANEATKTLLRPVHRAIKTLLTGKHT